MSGGAWVDHPANESGRALYALHGAEAALAEPPPDPGPDWRPEWGADPRLDPMYQPDRPEDIARRAAMITRELGYDDLVADARGRLAALVVPAARPDFRSAAAMAEPVDLGTYLVEDCIRPASLNVWAAAEGTAKSYARCELAIRASTGTGHSSITSPSPGHSGS